MSLVTYMNESCLTYVWVMRCWRVASYWGVLLSHYSLLQRKCEWLIHIRSYTYLGDMTHSYGTFESPWCESILINTVLRIDSRVTSHMNESRPIWMSHVPYEWVMSHMNESCPMWMSHVTLTCSHLCMRIEAPYWLQWPSRINLLWMCFERVVFFQFESPYWLQWP